MKSLVDGGFTFESDEAGRLVFKAGGASSGGRRLVLAGTGPGKERLWVRKWPAGGRQEEPSQSPDQASL